jgi:hypothetical protein
MVTMETAAPIITARARGERSTHRCTDDDALVK